MTTSPASSKTSTSPIWLLPAAAFGAAVAVSLGVYGNIHSPSGVGIFTFEFPAVLPMKAWFTTAAFGLAIFQVVSALWIYKNFPAFRQPRGGSRRPTGGLVRLRSCSRSPLPTTVSGRSDSRQQPREWLFIPFWVAPSTASSWQRCLSCDPVERRRGPFRSPVACCLPCLSASAGRRPGGSSILQLNLVRWKQLGKHTKCALRFDSCPSKNKR